MLAELCFFLRLQGQSTFLPFPGSAVSHFPWLAAPSSSFQAHHSNLWFHHRSSLFSDWTSSKDTCAYTTPTWISQCNLSKALTLNHSCEDPFAMEGDIFAGSGIRMWIFGGTVIPTSPPMAKAFLLAWVPYLPPSCLTIKAP